MMKPVAVATLKTALRNRPSGIIGSAARRSCNRKSTSRTAPPTNKPMTGAEPLQPAERDQLDHVLRQPAENRADEKDDDRRLEELLAPVEIAELPVQRRRDRRREDVRRHDPREMVEASEVADDRRQRGRD